MEGKAGGDQCSASGLNEEDYNPQLFLSCFDAEVTFDWKRLVENQVVELHRLYFQGEIGRKRRYALSISKINQAVEVEDAADR